MNFGRHFAMMLSIVAGTEGEPRQGGMVFKDGKYDLITEAPSTATGTRTATRPHCARRVKTESGARYEVTGRVLSLIPLRNRRKTPDGQELTTRITEGMTEYHCNGEIGYGLSEYLDQIVDGKPTGLANEDRPLGTEQFQHGHPHEQYRWLRENAPVYWHDEPGGRGFWAVTRFDDVRR